MTQARTELAMIAMLLAIFGLAGALAMASAGRIRDEKRDALLNPDSSAWKERAPDLFRVRMETSKGDIVIEVHREWAPNGTDHFYNLARNGYYDDTRFFRVVAGKWAQFGINGDPKISTPWRNRTIPDDPRVVSNTQGTIAYAFAVANGRATQLFFNLRDNSATHDSIGFAPFGKVVEGMDHMLALNSEYGETSGSGIRAGHQDRLFAEGNAYLDKNFPRLDRITKMVIVSEKP
jgi:peptidyl-prolyl cis-trans isomerase A (cyclophilin A)